MKKTVKFLLLALLVFALFLWAGCQSGDISLSLPTDKPSLIKLVVLALIALYEVVVRLIPTIGDLSVVSWIIRFLKWVSDGLNNRPTAK